MTRERAEIEVDADVRKVGEKMEVVSRRIKAIFNKAFVEQEQAGAHTGLAFSTGTAIVGGAIGALGQQGAGGIDALGGAVRALQAALPALGSAFGGATGGPLGAAAGLALGQGGAAVLERTIGAGFQGREHAISEVRGLTESRALAGQQLPPEAMAALIEGAMIRAGRSLRNEGAVRSAANSSTVLKEMFGF